MKLLIDDVYLIDDDKKVEMKIILRDKDTKRPEFDDPAEYVEYPKKHFMEETRWAYFHKMLSEEEEIKQLYSLTIRVSKTDILEPAPNTDSVKKSDPVKRKWENLSTGEKVEQEGPKLRFRFNRKTNMLDIVGPEVEGNTPLGQIYDIPIKRILDSWNEINGVMKAVRVSVHPLLHTERSISYFDPEGDDYQPMGEITDYDLYIEKQAEDRIYFNLILKDDNWGRYLVKFSVLRSKLRKEKEDTRAPRKQEVPSRKVLHGTCPQEIEVDGKIELPFHRRFKAVYQVDDAEFRIERFGYDIFITSDKGRLQGSLRYRPAIEQVVENYMRFVTDDRRVGSVTELDSFAKTLKFVDWIRKSGKKIEFKTRNYSERIQDDLHKIFPDDEIFMANKLKEENTEEIIDRGLLSRAEKLRDEALSVGHNPALVLSLFRKMISSNERNEIDDNVYEDYFGYIKRMEVDGVFPEDLLKGRIEFDDAQEAEAQLQELIDSPPEEPYVEKEKQERYRFDNSNEEEFEGNFYLSAVRRRQQNEWDKSDGSMNTSNARTVKKAWVAKKKKGEYIWREIDEVKPWANSPMRRNLHSTLENRKYTMYFKKSPEITEEFLRKIAKELKRRSDAHRLGKAMNRIHRKVVSKVEVERQEAMRATLPKPEMKKM